MRRAFLSTLAVAGLAVAAREAAALPQQHKPDPRLIGKWKSDRERTVKLWKYSKPLSDDERLRFESMFGKLTWRITPTHIFSEYDGEKLSQQYSVLGVDSQSVVIRRKGESHDELQQFFFEEGWLYVVSGYNIEFFKRVET